MPLYYGKEVFNDNINNDTIGVQHLAFQEIRIAKEVLIEYYEVGEDAIQLRESVGNKIFNKKQGAYQKFHVLKNDVVVEILDCFYTYDGTYVHIFSHTPNIPPQTEGINL